MSERTLKTLSIIVILLAIISLLMSFCQLNAQDTLFWDIDPALPRNQDLRRFDIYHNNTIEISLPDTNFFVRIDTLGRLQNEILKSTYMWFFNTLPGEHTNHWLTVVALDHLLNASGYSNIFNIAAQYPQTPFNTRVGRQEINAMPGDTLIVIIPKDSIDALIIIIPK